MSTPRVSLLSMEGAKETGAPIGIIELKAQLSVYRVLLHHPQLAQRISDLMETLTTQSELGARLRELIIMRIGWMNNGVYVWTQHWLLAPLFEVDQEELLATRDWTAHDHWSPIDRAALRATDDTVIHGAISDETWRACVDAFPTEREQLDLVATIGAWKMMAELLQSLQVPLEEGVTPWPPDGVSPNKPLVSELQVDDPWTA
ncbi:MAG: carboxymuconolactone decarboxylase family protein [Actinomycetota bacterium]